MNELKTCISVSLIACLLVHRKFDLSCKTSTTFVHVRFFNFFYPSDSKILMVHGDKSMSWFISVTFFYKLKKDRAH